MLSCNSGVAHPHWTTIEESVLTNSWTRRVSAVFVAATVMTTLAAVVPQMANADGASGFPVISPTATEIGSYNTANTAIDPAAPATAASATIPLTQQQADAFSTLVPTLPSQVPAVRSVSDVSGFILVVDSYTGETGQVVVSMLNPATGNVLPVATGSAGVNPDGSASSSATGVSGATLSAVDVPTSGYCGNCTVLGLAASAVGDTACLSFAAYPEIGLVIAAACDVIVIVLGIDVATICNAHNTDCYSPAVSMDPPTCPGFDDCNFRFHFFHGSDSVVSSGLSTWWDNARLSPPSVEDDYSFYTGNGDFNGVSDPAPGLTDYYRDAFGTHGTLSYCAYKVRYEAFFSTGSHGVYTIGDTTGGLAKTPDPFYSC